MSAVDAVIVGAGPAGLTAARRLKELGAGRVIVLDRDEEPGGVPRHSAHTGYGLRDLHRAMSGPAYARRLAEGAASAGAELVPRATVTSIQSGSVEFTSPSGREVLEARSVLLATGCRERPRTARLVPGTRPAGIYTTGWLQRLVTLEHGSPGRAAVIVGAEHVSYSAIATLAHAGCRTVAVVTPDSRPTTVRAFDLAIRARWRVPLITSAHIERIEGRDRVAAVVLEVDGEERTLECDCIVFTGDWIGEHELARRADLEMTATAPAVDGALRTSLAGVFAAGNLLHPATQADLCAIDGSHAAESMVAWLEGAPWPAASVPIVVQAPLQWCAPSRLEPQASPPRGRIMLATLEPLRRPRILATQGGRVLGSARLPWLVPTRPVSIPAPWIGSVDAQGAPVEISVA